MRILARGTKGTNGTSWAVRMRLVGKRNNTTIASMRMNDIRQQANNTTGLISSMSDKPALGDTVREKPKNENKSIKINQSINQK